MKFYVVITYYLVSPSFKFHEDSCINAHHPSRVAKSDIVGMAHVVTIPSLMQIGGDHP